MLISKHLDLWLLVVVLVLVLILVKVLILVLVLILILVLVLDKVITFFFYTTNRWRQYSVGFMEAKMDCLCPLFGAG